MGVVNSGSQINRDQIIKYWRSILIYIGEDPDREGLKKTPERIIKSWKEIFAGYHKNPKRIINGARFKDGACKEMVVKRKIVLFSTCEHHFLPFSCYCHIGYLPGKKLIGASKLSRIADMFARRLQIQEKMGTQIADFLMEKLKPLGVMVILEGKHSCYMCRGVKQTEAELITSAIRGEFWKPEVRNEFLMLIRKRD
jgi:GTP cyclohydrolase I